MDQKPTIGRIVHYVLARGIHRPAIVTHVSEGPVLVLTVFTCLGDPFNGRATNQLLNEAADVIEDPTGARAGSWHWPERD